MSIYKVVVAVPENEADKLREAIGSTASTYDYFGSYVYGNAGVR